MHSCADDDSSSMALLMIHCMNATLLRGKGSQAGFAAGLGAELSLAKPQGWQSLTHEHNGRPAGVHHAERRAHL